MRNLKKVLALVLALVMSLSLVTIANAADFTDADEINYEEAVDVMTTIGVFEGFEDSSFKPEGTLTREQAAKIITYMLLGENADRLSVSSSQYSDVAATRWSAPAIEYCTTLGIITGNGDGTYSPTSKLTGYAFAKMLLVALGYSAETEGFTGAGWTINVTRLATQVGLDDGIETLSWSTGISREEACQMALNAIKSPLVAYEGGNTIIVNGAEVSFGSGDAYYVTTTIAKEQRISEQRLSNSNEYTVEFGERYFPNLRLNSETDDYERPSHTWVYKSEEIGTYVDYETLVESYTAAITGKDLYELLGKSTIDKYGLTYYVDGVVNPGITAANMIRGNIVKYNTTGNGVLTQVFVDHDAEEITITSINTYLAQANSDYNSTNETLSLKVYQNDDTGTTKIVDVADVPAIADIAKDQYVLVTLSGKGLAAGVYDVVKVSDVEIMTDATVTKFTKSDGVKVASKVTVGGKEYSSAQKGYYDTSVLDEYDEALLTNMTYNVYLDQYGYVIGVDLYEGTKNYVFITGYDRTNSNISVKTATAAAIFLDGEMKEITVNVTDTNKNIDKMDGIDDNNASGNKYYQQWAGTGKVAENRWYTYTVNASNVYTLKPVADMIATNLADGTVIKSAYVYLDDGIAGAPNNGRAYGNDNSIYITVEAGSVDNSANGGTAKDAITEVNGLYTGVQNVDIELTNAIRADVAEANVYTVYDKDHYIIASIVLGEAQGSVNNYAYILSGAKNEELKSDGYYYWQFDAVVNGEKVTLSAKTKYTSTIVGLEPYHVQELRYDGDYVTTVKDVSADKFYTNNAVAINKQDIYDIGHVKTAGVMDTCSDAGCTLGGTRINGTINFDGRTLYTNYGHGDVGLAVASDAKAVLVQSEGVAGNMERKVSNCGSLSEAIGRLADADTTATGTQFKGRIVAVLNSAGVAQWVVVISDTPLIIGGGSVVPPSGDFTRVTWNGASYDIRYYGTMPTLAEMEQYLEAYFGTDITMLSHNSFCFANMPYIPQICNPVKVVAINVDGVRKAYVDAGHPVANTSLASLLGLSNGTYLLNQTTAAAAADITVTAGVANIGLTIPQTANDVNIYTAYSIEATNNYGGTARTTISYTDASGAVQSFNQSAGALFFAKGTVLTVKGQDVSNPAHGTFRRFENNTTGAALSEFRLVAAGGNSMTYTVQENVQITESTNYVKLIIDGTDYGFKPVDTTKVAATFMAPVNAEFALQGSLYAAGKSLLSQATGKSLGDLGSGAYTYTVRSDNHADANGIVNIVQAAQLTVNAGTVTVNGKTAASGWLVAVGDTLNFTGTTSIQVGTTPLAAGAPGVVTDTNGNIVSYTVQAGDAAITVN